METRRLGGTDLELSVVGLGTWVFGGRWGGASDEDSLAACHAAIDAGVNWIDTADIYGQHRAERIVGRAVRERRDEILIATKAGVAWTTEPEFRIWREASADYLRAAVDRSLEALGVDVIDLYQVHWPVTDVPAEETMGAMRELQQAGKIRAIGVSNYDADELAAAGAAGPLDAFQVGYHVMRREIEAAELPWCAEHDVGVLAYGPLAHGLLTGKMDETTTFGPDDWRAQSELFADDAFPERVAVVRELERVADEAGRPGGVAESLYRVPSRPFPSLLAVHVPHVLAAPRRAVGRVLIAAQAPLRRPGHRVERNRRRRLELDAVHPADLVHALHQRLEIGRIASLPSFTSVPPILATPPDRVGSAAAL